LPLPLLLLLKRKSKLLLHLIIKRLLFLKLIMEHHRENPLINTPIPILLMEEAMKAIAIATAKIATVTVHLKVTTKLIILSNPLTQQNPHMLQLRTIQLEQPNILLLSL
jgi:hypothetical protein